MITWEYLAGFLDGEGCFKIYGGYPRVTIGQNNLEVLTKIKEFLFLTNTITLSRGCYYLQINSRYDVEHLIRGVMPHLIVKKDDAEAILNHWNPTARFV